MVSTADAFWAAHLGCLPDDLFRDPLRIVIHGADLADYRGVFALFRAGRAVASVPPDDADALRALLSVPQAGSPDRFASALQTVSSAIIGPAYIGYADLIPPPAHPARALGPADAPAVDALRQACDATEWDHGGSDSGRPCSAVFTDGQIAALAGYEVWGGTIAHLYIITHPAFRNRGFGRSAFAHLAARALSAGLLPQYRTLQSNHASIRVAEALGFGSYAASMAVRLKGNT